MEGQTESLANPKRKEKREKEENQNATNHGSHRHGNKRKKRNKGEKTYLKGEELGSAAAHSSSEKSHGQHKIEVGGRRVFSEKTKMSQQKLKKI